MSDTKNSPIFDIGRLNQPTQKNIIFGVGCLRRSAPKIYHILKALTGCEVPTKVSERMRGQAKLLSDHSFLSFCHRLTSARTSLSRYSFYSFSLIEGMGFSLSLAFFSLIHLSGSCH
jgi:hypothetical protein